jgi:hypothetical protein
MHASLKEKFVAVVSNSEALGIDQSGRALTAYWHMALGDAVI